MELSEKVITAIVGAVAAIFGALIKALYDAKKNKQDGDSELAVKKEETSIDRLNMLYEGQQSQIQQLGADVKFVKAENKQLVARLNSLANGIASMSVFGKDSPLAIWMKHLDGRRIMHNKAYEKMIGINYLDVAGMTDYEIMIRAYPDPTDEEKAEVKRITDEWDHYDEQSADDFNGRNYTMGIEQAFHVKRPSKTFLVFSVKWVDYINGQQIAKGGMAIKLERVIEVIDHFNRMQALEDLID